MKANYNLTGTKRKELVQAIAEITGEKADYKRMPTCAYEIGNITVDKEGTLICEDEEKLGRVMVGLGQMGYYPDAEQPADPEPTEVPETKEAAEPETDSEATPTDEQDAETEPATEPETDSETTDPAEPKEPAENTEKAPELTISLPLAAANVGTLTNILFSKGNLIRHALGVTDIRINVTEDNKIEFPWFTREVTAEEAKAYTLFISLLCKLSKELKHASSRPVETDNEKYAFRCFLLRLGFIGADYKEARKILLQNLTGSAAFRNGAPAKTEE